MFLVTRPPILLYFTAWGENDVEKQIGKSTRASDNGHWNAALISTRRVRIWEKGQSIEAFGEASAGCK